MSGFALSKLSPTPMQDKTGFNGAHHHEGNMGSFLNLSLILILAEFIHYSSVSCLIQCVVNLSQPILVTP